LTPGAVLLRFLHYFGRAFEPHLYGISVGRGRLGNPFPREHKVDPATGLPVTDAVVIEDPLDLSRNVARSCFGFGQVQWLFAQCLAALEVRASAMTAVMPVPAV
ncbi:unnamed protein product, partial [Phaeothamnion confervicola]